jgi:hypothetical protein
VRAATLRTAPRPQALRMCRTRTRTGTMTDSAPGARLLASRDAGLPPAPRLPRSRLTPRVGERSVNDPWRTVTVKQAGPRQSQVMPRIFRDLDGSRAVQRSPSAMLV